MKNYYEILGVSEKATSEEIKKAYRKLAKEKFPDIVLAGKVKGVDYTQEDWDLLNAQMVEINIAYEILGDEKKKNKYDIELYTYRREEERKAKAKSEKERKEQEERAKATREKFYNSTRSRERSTHQGTRRTSSHQEQQDNYYQQRARRQGAAYRTTRDSSEYSRENTRRYRTEPSFFDKLRENYREVRADEKQCPFKERHARIEKANIHNFNRKIRKGKNPNVIVYRLESGTLHVAAELFYQLSKLGKIADDSIPKYIIRNRILATALAGAIIIGGVAGGPKTDTSSDIPTDITASQESTLDQDIAYNDTVYEPTVQMNRYYIVQFGDTLSEIAEEAGVSTRKIQAASGIEDASRIQGGRTKLTIPYTIDREDLQYYTDVIQTEGKSLYDIATDFNTDVETLYRLNPESIEKINGTYIIMSDTILVPNFISQDQLQRLKDNHSYGN